MRLMLDWAMAAKLPTIIVSAETMAASPAHWVARPGKAVTNTRRSAANPAAFAPTDMNAVTTEGAPSYTSGVHMWKGTAATLKLRPTRMSAAPARSSALLGCAAARTCARLVEPLPPYTSAIPYTRKPEANAPSRKYFIADSSDEGRGRAKPERM